jgi:hypothetical protein
VRDYYSTGIHGIKIYNTGRVRSGVCYRGHLFALCIQSGTEHKYGTVFITIHNNCSQELRICRVHLIALYGSEQLFMERVSNYYIIYVDFRGAPQRPFKLRYNLYYYMYCKDKDKKVL